jgi:hypothetical protein
LIPKKVKTYFFRGELPENRRQSRTILSGNYFEMGSRTSAA